MALGTSIALSQDSPTDVDTTLGTFVLRFADEAKAIYSIAGLTPPIEYKLSVQHDVEKDGTKRHVVRIDATDDDALGKISTGSSYCVIRQPVNSTFTSALMKTLVYMMCDLLIEGGAGANIDKLLNDEL